MRSYEDYEKLVEKYPSLYGNSFYFECAIGWYDLIDELSGKIVGLSKNFKAEQVKEKFGGLRFYYRYETDNEYTEEEIGKLEEATKIVADYEDKSFGVCEVCGQSGEVRKKGWVQTLCDNHAR